MKTQTVNDMVNGGATKEEAEKATRLFEMLYPCLKINKNGLISTTYGDKTPLGLYRTIRDNQFI